MQLLSSSSLGLVALLLTAGLAQAQTFPECTRALLRTDECAAVVNPSACYNQFRWNTRTLGCIDGANDTERKARVSLTQLETVHGLGMRRGKLMCLGRRANVVAVWGRLCVIG